MAAPRKPAEKKGVGNLFYAGSQRRGRIKVPDTLSSGYTLLEVILALSLTAVILGLIAMAIHVNLGVANKSGGQVEEARLARGLLQRIAEDLRNTIPFTPKSSSSSGSSDTSAPSQTAASSGASTDSSASTSSAAATSSDSTTTPDTSAAGGICGGIAWLQMDTSRRPRPLRLSMAAARGDTVSAGPLSDIKTVSYSLGAPETGDLIKSDAASNSLGGLYRRELERAESAWAAQQGQSDMLTQATEQFEEVVDLQFTYYDGATVYDSWDSTQQGKLPSAIKVALSIRRPAGQSSSAAENAAEDLAAPVVYDMLIDLPNSQVKPSKSASQASQGSSSKSADSSAAQPPQSSSGGASNTAPTGTTNTAPKGGTK